MAIFQDFLDTWGNGTACRRMDSRTQKQFAKLLPSSLLDFWSEQGLCAYGNGFLWLVDPSDLEQPMTEWFPGASTKVPFVRTAFGDIIHWDGSQATLLDVNHGQEFDIGPELDSVFYFYLCDAEVRSKILDEELFKKALVKLGPLQYDECYGFKLALALGGKSTLKNLAKVKLREYLSILAQLHEDR